MGAGTEWLRIGTLARRAGVPPATIKHYLREGLLPAPVKRTARNMAYYDASLVERVVAIKRMQREHFLPLSVIKQVLAGAATPNDDAVTAAAIASVLRESAPKEARTRGELYALGVRPGEISFLEGLGLITPEGEGDQARYAGDDLSLLRTLGAARRAGLKPEMLPTEILGDYVGAIRALVRAELGLFRAGVLPRAGANVSELTEVATTLSERLVVLIRRKLLLPTLAELAREARPERGRKARPKSRRPFRRKP